MARTIILFTTFSIILSLSTIGIDCKKSDCNQIADLANDVLVVSSKTRKFPTNPTEFDTYCKKSLQLVNDITTLSKQCFKDEMRNILSLVSYSYKQRIKILCKSKTNQNAKNLLSSAACLNKHRSKMAKCFDKTAARVLEMKTKPNDLKFPYLCCETGHVRKCIEKIDAKDCKDAIQFYVDSSLATVNGFVDRTCGEYNYETDKCDKLSPITVKNKDGTTPSLIMSVGELISSM